MKILPVPTHGRGGGEVLASPGSLLAEGERVARLAAAPLTRSTYATAYRAFGRHLEGRLGRAPVPEDLTEDALAGYRDHLERAGRARATIAKELAALRRLAHALAGDYDVDAAAVARVKANRVAPRAPRALTGAELERLWAMPDLRTRRGRRDRALLMLLGAAGLGRAEACALTYADLEELRRHPSPHRRDTLASAGQRTAWVVHVREPKRGRARTVDLAEPVVHAIQEWTRSRPDAATDCVFVSLPRNRPPGPLRPRAVNSLVEAYATRARLPADRRTPHVLRHTFCTLLADAGAGLEVVAELAGHADLRTTKGYVTVSPARRASAVRRGRGRSPSEEQALELRACRAACPQRAMNVALRWRRPRPLLHIDPGIWRSCSEAAACAVRQSLAWSQPRQRHRPRKQTSRAGSSAPLTPPSGSSPTARCGSAATPEHPAASRRCTHARRARRSMPRLRLATRGVITHARANSVWDTRVRVRGSRPVAEINTGI